MLQLLTLGSSNAPIVLFGPELTLTCIQQTLIALGREEASIFHPQAIRWRRAVGAGRARRGLGLDLTPPSTGSAAPETPLAGFPLINRVLSTWHGKGAFPRGSGKAGGRRAAKSLAGIHPGLSSRLVSFYTRSCFWGLSPWPPLPTEIPDAKHVCCHPGSGKLTNWFWKQTRMGLLRWE